MTSRRLNYSGGTSKVCFVTYGKMRLIFLKYENMEMFQKVYWHNIINISKSGFSMTDD